MIMNKSFSISILGVFTLLVGIATAAPKDPGVYADIIASVLEAKCTGCHGEEKDKGDLRLDTYDFIIKGGDEGGDTNVVAGNPEKSYLFERVMLPLDDDEHMPPDDKDQLTPGEVKLIKWWIQSGAKKDIKLAAAKAPKNLEGAIKAALALEPGAAEDKPAPAATAVALTEAQKKVIADTKAKVSAAGASLMEIAADTPQLRFSALNVAKDFGDAQLAMLKPVAAHILWLDLGGTAVTDKGLVQVAGMKNLTKLYLQNTAVGDAGLNQLRGLGKLEYLNLYGTKVSDAGVAKLGGLKNLKSLYAWQTKVSEKGAANLKKRLPNLAVNLGWSEKDKPVVVASAAPAKTPEKKAAAKPVPAKSKPAPPKPTPPAKTKPAPAKPAPAAKAPAEVELAKALADAKVAAAQAKKTAADAEKAAQNAKAVAAQARKAAEALEKAAAALSKAKK